VAAGEVQKILVRRYGMGGGEAGFDVVAVEVGVAEVAERR
jgi:hypothetical protein